MYMHHFQFAFICDAMWIDFGQPQRSARVATQIIINGTVTRSFTVNLYKYTTKPSNFILILDHVKFFLSLNHVDLDCDASMSFQPHLKTDIFTSQTKLSCLCSCFALFHSFVSFIFMRFVYACGFYSTSHFTYINIMCTWAVTWMEKR